MTSVSYTHLDVYKRQAQERGLPNIRHYIDSIPSMIDEKAIAMFERNKVYDRLELQARVDILTEEYRKSVKAEVLTLLDISKKDILPALVKEIKFYSDALRSLNTHNSYYERKIKHLCEDVYKRQTLSLRSIQV